MGNYKITSQFHATESFREGAHKGIDFAMKEGTDLKAVAEGIIRIKDYGNVNAGKTVFIDTADGKTFIYGHLKDFAVNNGQQVKVGDLIGHSGNTGASTGAHLHFGVKVDGEFADPSAYVPLIQKMNELKEVAFTQMNVADIFNEAMQQFSEALSSMLLHIVTLLPGIPKAHLVLSTAASWLC